MEVEEERVMIVTLQSSVRKEGSGKSVRGACVCVCVCVLVMCSYNVELEDDV